MNLRSVRGITAALTVAVFLIGISHTTSVLAVISGIDSITFDPNNNNSLLTATVGGNVTSTFLVPDIALYHVSRLLLPIPFTVGNAPPPGTPVDPNNDLPHFAVDDNVLSGVAGNTASTTEWRRFHV